MLTAANNKRVGELEPTEMCDTEVWSTLGSSVDLSHACPLSDSLAAKSSIAFLYQLKRSGMWNGWMIGSYEICNGVGRGRSIPH